MKNLYIYLTVALLFVGICIQAQVSDTVTIEDETITSSSNPALLNITAGQSIIIKPTTWIRSGTSFSAVITADAYLPISLDSNENYVFTRAYQAPMTSSAGIRNNSDVIESITYIDGLGRPIQQVGIKASPDRKDLVTHIEYDTYGRQARQLLPFERQSGALGSHTTVNITNDINSYYKSKYPNDFTGVTTANVNAYSESIFEPSPLNRVLEQAAPGMDWKANPNADTDHTIKFDWTTNTATEVSYFDVDFTTNNTENPSLVKDEYYAANELQVTITKDENWQPGQTHANDHTTKEYTDKLGRVVLKRTYNENVAHDTHYVYDDFGNLTYVIPPKVIVSNTNEVSSTELAELCYQYKYDYRNRLIEKKIPGKELESIVYNKLDQPVMTQDANQAAKNEWLFTKYDAFGRVAYTGSLKNNESRAALQSSADNPVYSQFENKQTSNHILSETTIYYTNNAIPRFFDQIYTINYYDNYTFDHSVPNPGSVLGQPTTTNVKGLPTGSKVRVLGTNDWITTVTYYDAKKRPIYVHSTNAYLNTVDIIETKLDFVGKVLESKTTHTKDNNTPIITVDTFTYDHVARLVSQSQKINNQATEEIIANTYDEIGQLETKEVGGGLQEVDYAYNVRGWLTDINDVNVIGNDLFTFKINYDKVTENLDASSLYNGNISETIWKTANDNTRRAYGYKYDALNRITHGKDNANTYRLQGVEYDKNGNITKLVRRGDIDPNVQGFDLIDILNYTYHNDGNKLHKVIDTGNKSFGFKDGTNTNDDYEYDLNGNMTIDRNKGIHQIRYNHLNMPIAISSENDLTYGFLTYTYDANGNKLEKKLEDYGNNSYITTQYAGNYIYENSELKFFNHPEGYIEPENDGSFSYIYQLKDLQNSVRVTFSDKDKDGKVDLVRSATDIDGDGDNAHEILQERNFYPFGMLHKGYNNTIRGVKNNIKTFQDQEFTEDLGLNTHEWRFRVSDPSIGRFWQIDPLAEKYVHNGTYNFSENRVIDGIELEGLEYVNANKARLLVKSNGSVHLNFSNMTNPTRNSFDTVNSNPDYWRDGDMGAAHINTRVGQFNFGSVRSKLNDIRGLRSQETRITPPTAKRTGQPDRRFKDRGSIGNGPIVGGRERGSAKALLAIEAVRIGFGALYWAFAQYDESVTEDQLKLLRSAGLDLEDAISEGLIPENNMNIEDLSEILNGIFSGGAINNDLNKLGIKIYNTYNNDNQKSTKSFFKRLSRQTDKQIKKGKGID